MADEGGKLEDFDVEKDLPTFLVPVLDSTDAIFQGTFKQGVPEAHAEVIDQSIRLIRSTIGCCNMETGDKDTLEALVTAFADVLTLLRHHIVISPVTPTTVAERSITVAKVKKKNHLEDRVLIFLSRCLKSFGNWVLVGPRLDKCWGFQGGLYTEG